MNKDLMVLGIETSCDETAAAVVCGGRLVLSNVIASQTEIHRPYGGVVPEIAARRHIETVSPVVDEALEQAGVRLSDIDGVAVANGPGLAGALLVGLSYAKALAYGAGKPIVGVHHIEGHVCANYLGGDWMPPFLSLVVSGGHTLLLAVRDYTSYEVLGRTRDDAAGEAFDKAARAMGLPYPGGPRIDKLSAAGNAERFRFTRARLNDGSKLDFSFSGLKSNLRQMIERGVVDLADEAGVADMAASFQRAVVDVLAEHTMLAAEETGFKDIALAGGVAANRGLRNVMTAACESRGLRLHMPDIVYCTDNAAMIASRGYYALAEGKTDDYGLNAYPSRAVGA